MVYNQGWLIVNDNKEQGRQTYDQTINSFLFCNSAKLFEIDIQLYGNHGLAGHL